MKGNALMDAYMYRAALLCEDCASAHALCDVDHYDHHDCTSECTAVGPYANGGGEADSPAHCDACGVFLENPLTSDGVDYVRDQIWAAQIDKRERPVLATWITFYADDLAS